MEVNRIRKTHILLISLINYNVCYHNSYYINDDIDFADNVSGITLNTRLQDETVENY